MELYLPGQGYACNEQVRHPLCKPPAAATPQAQRVNQGNPKRIKSLTNGQAVDGIRSRSS